jgi:hypothetical protein
MNSFFLLVLLAGGLAAQPNLQFVNGLFANIDAQRVIRWETAATSSLETRPCPAL